MAVGKHFTPSILHKLSLAGMPGTTGTFSNTVSPGLWAQNAFADRIAEKFGPGVVSRMEGYVRPQLGGNPLRQGLSSGGGGSDVMTLAEMGKEPDEIKKAYETLQKSKGRAAVGGPGKSKSIISRLSGVSSDVVGDALTAGSRVLDYISRPGQAVTANIEEKIKDVNNVLKGGLEWKDLDDIATGIGMVDPSQWKATLGGLAGKNKEGSAGILREAGLLAETMGTKGVTNFLNDPAIANRIVKGGLQFGLDIATDPGTYVGAGLVRGAVKGAVTAKGLEAAGMLPEAAVAAESTITALEQGVRGGIGRGLKKMGPGDLAAVKNAAVGTINETLNPAVNTTTRTLFKDTYKQALKTQGVVNATTRKSARGAADQVVADYIKKHVDDAARILDEQMGSYGRRKLALNVGVRQAKKKNILEASTKAEDIFNPLRKATAGVKSKFGAVGAFENALSIEKTFPGMTQYARRIAASKGLRTSKKFHDEMRELFYGVTKEEREAMSHMIESGGQMAPRQVARVGGGSVDINDILDQAKAANKTMGDEAVKMGLMKATDQVDDTYLYHWYKKRKDRKLAEKFRKDRGAALQAGQTTPLNYSLKAAQAEGLNPETDLWRIMLNKQAKDSRDKVRHFYEGEVLGKYARAFDKAIPNPEEHGLVKLNLGSDGPLKSTNWKTQWKNKHVYIPKEYNEALINYEKILKLDNSDDVNGILHGFDVANRWFKFSRTIPRPAYHVNNMLFDGTMSWFDGVRAKDYSKVLSRWAGTTKAGKAVGLKVKPYKLGLNELGFDESWDLFQKYGTGGNYPNTELPVSLREAGQSRAGATRLVTGPAQALRRGSEMREDGMRYIHWQRGLEEEFEHLANGRKLTGPDLQATLEQAAENASHRVNRYHHDYSALTKTEQQVLRRVIPFYTFSKKTAPLLLETAFLTPGKFTAFEKLKRGTETALGIEHGDAGFDNARWPDYLGNRDSIMQLDNEEENRFLDFSNIMPSNFMQQQFGASSGEEGFADLFSRFSPAARVLPEIAYGKSLFGNRPIDSPAQWAAREFAPWTPITGTLDRKTKDYRFQNLAGIPIRSLTKEQQVAAIKNEGKTSRETVGRLQESLQSKGLDLVTSNRKTGVVYRLLDRNRGVELGVFKTPAEAQEAANRLAG